ncbi:hypothetical protein K2X92_05320 [Candidatus Gracilibacteria bacterium]|nr:hypothetical protein [Candidatus Gracilibacteria bacterium]
MNKSKNITININYLNQLNKSITLLEKKYSSNESYKKTLNNLKSYVAFLSKEQTALRNKEGEVIGISKKNQNKIIQGIYQLTEKKYKGNFKQNNQDVCAMEFGNEWQISQNSRDAHLMLTKDNTAWDTLKGSISCNNYNSLGEKNFGFIYSIRGGVELKNNRVNCNSSYQVACEKITSTSNNVENWRGYMNPVTKSQRDDFMNQINSELSGKINSDSNFIYLNNYLSISKKEFSGIQLYKDPTIQTCPTGFSLAQYEYDGKNNHLASNYTLEVLGYYLSKNPNSYNFVELQEVGNRYAHDYRFWMKQDSWTSNYMLKFNEEQIKQRGYDATFSVFNVRMQNAYLNWKKPILDNTYFIDDHFGGSDKMSEKRPTLCQKNGTKDDFSKLPGNIKKYDGRIIMNQGSSEADSFLMYTYQKIIAEYNGGGDNLYQYFLPLYRDSGYHFYRQSK